MNAKPPTGPLFIVGMPRSGTKLLRGMLNRHARLRFSDFETEFFPYWVAHWNQFGTIGNRDGFERFYRECKKLPFFVYHEEQRTAVDCDQWFRRCNDYTPAAVFEALMKTVLGIDAQDEFTIWGDKSPSYIRHVPLLIQQFPAAIVIHIVRDVRDYSYSMNKAWGKSMLRAAQRWTDDVSKCRADGQKMASAYLEVRYEDLLADATATLTEICAFAGIEFEPDMLTLDRSIEKKGDAKGMTGVLTDNAGKYQVRMSGRTIMTIERIAGPTLRALNYPCGYNGPSVRLPKWRLRMLQMWDGVNLVRAAISNRGLIGALGFHFRYFRMSGNRFN